MVKINFNFDTKYGVFRDALHLPEDHQFSDEEIEVMKQERINNWIDAVENPPPPIEESIEEVVEEVVQPEEQAEDEGNN